MIKVYSSHTQGHAQVLCRELTTSTIHMYIDVKYKVLKELI